MRLQPSKDTRNAKLKETDKDGNGSKVVETVGNITKAAATSGTNKNHMWIMERKLQLQIRLKL